MNVRKRGLALLMCICMIFTLLPFSVFAEDAENGSRGGTEGTAQPSVVYGTYDEKGWKVDNSLNAETAVKHYPSAGEVSKTGADITYSKTAAPAAEDDTYDITLNVSATVKKAAVVLVIDASKDAYECCVECGWSNSISSGETDTSGNPLTGHSLSCAYYKSTNNINVTENQTFLASEKRAALEFINNFAGSVPGTGRFVQIVSYQGTANIHGTWNDVSTENGKTAAINAINSVSYNAEAEHATNKNLEQGLSKALSCFNDKNSAVANMAADNKYTVVMTNSRPDAYGEACVTETGKTGNDISYKTKATADELKEECTLCTIYNRNHVAPRLDGNGFDRFLSEIATSSAWAEDRTAQGNEDHDSWQIKTVGKEFVSKLNVSSVIAGFTVTDPMGKYIRLKDTSLSECKIEPATTEAPTTIVWSPQTGIVTDNGNSATVSYTLKYQVSLNTNGEGFEFDTWYPTNGETILSFVDGQVYEKRIDYTRPVIDKKTGKQVIYNGEPMYYKTERWWDIDVSRSFIVPGVKALDQLTIKPADAEFTYDGNEKTSSDIVVNGSETAVSPDKNGVYWFEYKGIKYAISGISVSVKDGPAKNVGKYTLEISGTPIITAYAENEEQAVVTDKFNIEIDTGILVINPAEKIVIKITGNTATKTYDGTEKSVTGYTTDVKDSSITVNLKEGKAAIAKGTNVDTYYMGLTADDFTATSINYKKIAIEVTDGYLTIKERPYHPNPPITDKITVEITGNSDSVVYDGAEHSVKDYTVKISDSRYTEKDFTFSGKALASGINAGTYEMGLKADQFKNTNARFKNVEFIIKADGVLTITQRPLTITAGSAEGIAPVTCDKYTVEGLATGDKVDSVKITGIQSEPGESPNVASDAVIKNAKGEDVTANYKITYVNGVLKAIEVLNKEIHFNYVIGYTDGTIRPSNDISRAEVATIFFRLLTDEAREQYTTTAGDFTDVKAGMWCNRAIATLTNMGIIKGYTDGSFQPNKSITRAELATIIARFAKLDVNTKTFSDINGHWAQKNIELAAGNGWINGYEDGTFRPNNNITRAETFAMINRVLDRQTESVSDLLPTSEMNMWSDNLNENAWYYKDVQEATNYHKCDRVGDSVYEKWTEKVPDIDWASYQI